MSVGERVEWERICVPPEFPVLWAGGCGMTARCFPHGPGWASGCVKPLTPHGGWWTRGSPRYQVLSLQHLTLDSTEERRTAQGPWSGHVERGGKGKRGGLERRVRKVKA